MNITYQLAKTSDIEAISDLLTILLSQEADFTPDAELQKKGLQLIIDNPEKGQLIVAKENNNVIGMVNLLFTISTALGAKVAILEDMIVQPEFRKNGVGGQLIEKAIEVAKEKECKRITLLTDTDNFAAHSFYNRHGFEKSAMLPFRIKL